MNKKEKKSQKNINYNDIPILEDSELEGAKEQEWYQGYLNKKKSKNMTGQRHTSGCMVCGSELVYNNNAEKNACFYCKEEKLTNTLCANNHFVCDDCHTSDAKTFILSTCINSTEKDLIALFKKIVSHKALPMHGPEYHAIVPAVILTVYRNNGHEVDDDLIETVINRGLKLSGGSCGFSGTCGAAAGVGNGFAAILKSSPLKGKQRGNVMKITSGALNILGEYHAPRCCLRDCFLSLKYASDISKEYTGITLKADETFSCSQSHKNKECIRMKCPLYVK